MRCLIGILIVLCTGTLHSQIYTEIRDFQFNEITPIWSRVVIDSSQIIEGVNNGTDYIRNDGPKEIIGDKFIKSYLTTNTKDIIGYFVECIDLRTGEQLWNYVYDQNVDNHKEAALAHNIEDNLFKIYGLRMIEESDFNEIEMIYNAPGNLAITSFDIETGALVDKIVNDDNITESTFYAVNYFDKTFFIGDSNGINYHFNGNHFSDSIRLSIVDEFGGLERVSTFKVLDGRPDSFRASVSKPFSIDNSIIGSFGVYDGDNVGENTQNYFFKIDENYDLEMLIDIKDYLRVPEGQQIGYHSKDRVVLYSSYQPNLPNQKTDFEYVQIDFQTGALTKYDLSDTGMDYVRSAITVTSDGVLVVIAQPLDSKELHIFSSVGSENLKLNKVLTSNLIEEDDIFFLVDISNYEDTKIVLHLNQGYVENNAIRGNWIKQFLIDLKDLDILSSNDNVAISDRAVLAYPNPTNNVISYEIPEWLVGEVEIQMFDFTGRQVFAASLNAIQSQGTIDMSGFASGSYSLVLKSTQGSITKKVMKL